MTKTKKSLTVFLPDGNRLKYEQDKGGVKDIAPWNNGVIGVIYADGTEDVFANMPYIYRR